MMATLEWPNVLSWPPVLAWPEVEQKSLPCDTKGDDYLFGRGGSWTEADAAAQTQLLLDAVLSGRISRERVAQSLERDARCLGDWERDIAFHPPGSYGRGMIEQLRARVRGYRTVLAAKGFSYESKGEGTCKQGERADLTGCTPATDEGGKQPSPKPEEPKAGAARISIGRSRRGFVPTPVAKLAQKQADAANELLVSRGKQPVKDWEIVMLPLDKVHPTQSGEDYDNASSRELARHIGKFGSSGREEDYWPIAVDEKGNIIDGNHRHAARKIAGIETIPVLRPKTTKVEEKPKPPSLQGNGKSLSTNSAVSAGALVPPPDTKALPKKGDFVNVWSPKRQQYFRYEVILVDANGRVYGRSEVTGERRSLNPCRGGPSGRDEWVSDDETIDSSSPNFWLDRKGLSEKAFPSIQDAGHWLADKWALLEGRYGRAGALTMAVAMLASMPIPGNIVAVVSAAEAIRGLSGFGKDFPEAEFLAKAMEGKPYSRVQRKSWTPPKAKGGFTGTRRDSRGAKICYRDGVRVPCEASGEATPLESKKPDEITDSPKPNDLDAIKGELEKLTPKDGLTKVNGHSVGNVGEGKFFFPDDSRPYTLEEAATRLLGFKPKAEIPKEEGSAEGSEDTTTTDVGALDKQLRKSFLKWSKSVKGKVKQAIQDYVSPSTDSGRSFRELNAALRKCPDERCLDDDQKEWMDSLRRALSAAPELKEPITVYRGLSIPKDQYEEFVGKLEAGGTLSLVGIVSTSLNERRAKDYARQRGDGAVIFKIKARTGLYVQPLADHFLKSEDAWEKEWGRNQEFVQSHKTRYTIGGVKESLEPVEVEAEQEQMAYLASQETPADGVVYRKEGDVWKSYRRDRVVELEEEW